MRDLNFDHRRLQKEHEDGPHGTRRAHSCALAQMANALHEAGYRGLRAKGLKGKHVEALVRHWRDRRLSDATLMNRMAHVRWWADQVGKANLVGSNAEYGIGPRWHVSDGTKRRDLDEAKLARANDAHVRMALRLQAEFGHLHNHTGVLTRRREPNTEPDNLLCNETRRRRGDAARATQRFGESGKP